jgi:hypothetical protein
MDEGEPRVWRVRVYLMENDPQALLRRLSTDFPGAAMLKEERVPA